MNFFKMHVVFALYLIFFTLFALLIETPLCVVAGLIFGGWAVLMVRSE